MLSVLSLYFLFICVSDWNYNPLLHLSHYLSLSLKANVLCSMNHKLLLSLSYHLTPLCPTPMSDDSSMYKPLFTGSRPLLLVQVRSRVHVSHWICTMFSGTFSDVPEVPSCLETADLHRTPSTQDFLLMTCRFAPNSLLSHHHLQVPYWVPKFYNMLLKGSG